MRSEREGSTIREVPQGASRNPHERMHGARGPGRTTLQRCSVRRDRPELSRPKLAQANSFATSLRFSQRELRWAPEGSHTGRWCVIAHQRESGHEFRVSTPGWVGRA